MMLVRREAKLDAYYESWSATAKEGYDAIVSTNLISLLSAVGFIRQAELGLEALQHLASLCSYLTLPEGAKVFRQGDPADCFYIVLKGAAEVQIDEQKLVGRRMSVSGTLNLNGGSAGSRTSEEHVTRGYGETFGLASFVLNAPTRQYGMVTTERSLFLIISKENFRPFLSVNPTLETCLIDSTKRFLLQRYAMLRSSIFHSFSEAELEVAARAARIERISQGQTVYSKGDAATAFYVVAHGELHRDYGSGGSSGKRQLKVGAYFGEIGVMLPRTGCLATIKATVDSTLLVIGKEDFVRLLQGRRPRGLSVVGSLVSNEQAPGAPPPYLNGGGTDGSGKPVAGGLKRTLELELLIKLQRARAPLDVLLQYQPTHRALVRFAVPELRGGLRVRVYNSCVLLLTRVRAAIRETPKFKEQTVADIAAHLADQAASLVRMIQDSPCPPSATSVAAGPKEPQQATAGLGGAIERLAETERRLVARFGDAYVWGVSTLQPSQMEQLLADVCTAGRALLDLGHAAFSRSGEYVTLLESMGAYDKEAHSLVDPDDLAEVEADLMAAPAAEPVLLLDLPVASAAGGKSGGGTAHGGTTSRGAHGQGGPSLDHLRRGSAGGGPLGLGASDMAKAHAAMHERLEQQQRQAALPGTPQPKRHEAARIRTPPSVSTALLTLTDAVRGGGSSRLTDSEYSTLMELAMEAKRKLGDHDAVPMAADVVPATPSKAAPATVQPVPPSVPLASDAGTPTVAGSAPKEQNAGNEAPAQPAHEGQASQQSSAPAASSPLQPSQPSQVPLSPSPSPANASQQPQPAPPHAIPQEGPAPAVQSSSSPPPPPPERPSDRERRGSTRPRIQKPLPLGAGPAAAEPVGVLQQLSSRLAGIFSSPRPEARQESFQPVSV